MTKDLPPLRIGHGYDAHRFSPDRRLVLGGVEIPGGRGLAGHSDADVLTHSVIDALLGAMALGDLGHHFPPGDERWRNAVSLDLLSRTREMVDEAGGRVAQVDVVVYLEKPKLAPHLQAMRRNLSRVLRIPEAFVSIKATTTEGMGFVGREEGAAATAVVLVATQ
jgi:2-C-methyl-D-erythritol 2,4-cyclodiphosphate synthase